MLKKIYNKVTHEWDTSVEEALKSFIRLPALSHDFDKKWEENGVLPVSYTHLLRRRRQTLRKRF